jgi:hypothetical protein
VEVAIADAPPEYSRLGRDVLDRCILLAIPSQETVTLDVPEADF